MSLIPGGTAAAAATFTETDNDVFKANHMISPVTEVCSKSFLHRTDQGCPLSMSIRRVVNDLKSPF